MRRRTAFHTICLLLLLSTVLVPISGQPDGLRFAGGNTPSPDDESVDENTEPGKTPSSEKNEESEGAIPRGATPNLPRAHETPEDDAATEKLADEETPSSKNEEAGTHGGPGGHVDHEDEGTHGGGKETTPPVESAPHATTADHSTEHAPTTHEESSNHEDAHGVPHTADDSGTVHTASSNTDAAHGVSTNEHGAGGEHGASTLSHEEEGEAECEEHHGGADVVLLLFFMLLIGLVTRYALHKLPVPYTALLLIMGLILGAMQIRLTSHTNEEEVMTEGENETEGHDEGAHGGHGGHGGHAVDVQGHDSWEKFAIGINAWRSLAPELMLLVFLPALIFASAFSLNFHITKKSFGQVLLLAGPGVVIGTCIVAVFVKYAFPYGWCWPKCFMFGAMISATDPVAVVALLKEVGASKRLGTVIEGESLFNDGTAFVFFLLFRDMIPTNSDCLDDKYNCRENISGTVCENDVFVPQGCLNERDLGQSITFFLQLALGGPAIGILFGLAATFWIQYIYNDLLTEISVTLVTAYLTFYVAEDVAEVSGVLAVVALGLFMGSFAKDRISSAVHEPMHVFWEMMEYLANTLIFVYTGLKISVELFDSTNPSSNFIGSREWGLAVFLYLMLQVIRFITIFMLLPVLQRMGYGMTWRDALVAVWGGLRGAVGLALALIVQLDRNHLPPSFRSYTIFYLGFVVIATLLLNGTTMPYLLKFLGVTKTSPEKLEVLFYLLKEMEENGDKRAMDGEDELLGIPDYSEIHKLTALNISKIVPTSKEIETVIESATVTNHPAGLNIRHSLHQTSVSRFNPTGRGSLAEIVEEVARGPEERVLDVEKPQNLTMIEQFKAKLFGGQHRRFDLDDSPKKETFTPDMLVQDLRSRLLQGVKTAYAEWLEKGFIGAKPMFDLIASSDYAIDRLDQPICDWEYVEKVAKPARWRVEIQKIKSNRCGGPLGDFVNKGISKILFDTMHHAVLLARTYIMAHHEAEHAIHEYIKSEIDDGHRMPDLTKKRIMEDAVEMVIRESKEASKAAYEMMRDFRMVYPEILRAIKTRLSAQEVLLEKQAYVHQIECAGLIEEREATLIRDMIDAKIKYLTYNTLVLDLPNSHDLLHSHPIFINLSNSVFDSQIWPHAKPKVFTKGNRIFSIGEEPKNVTVVVRGLVKMIDSEGNEAPIGDGFGSVLGVSEIMLNRPRAMTMHCETTSEVIQIERQMYETFVERYSSVRTRSWQLTGMMLTYLNPWGDFINRSILDLASVFRTAQVLDFEPGDELRVRTPSYLLMGTVKEAGFIQASPRSIIGPSPLGPGLGIYNCVSSVKILRIPTPEAPGHSQQGGSFGNTKKMLSRTSQSMQKITTPVGSSHSVQPRSQTARSLLEIPEGAEEVNVPDDDRPRKLESQSLSVAHSMSADLEMRNVMRRRLTRNSIEF